MKKYFSVLCLALTFFLFPLCASAYPVSSYKISGFIDNDNSSQLAADHLKRVDVGDSFRLFMTVQKLTPNDYFIGLSGKLGQQHIAPENAGGFYYGNDNGLSGLGVNSYGISNLTPETDDQISGGHLYITLRGQELFYPYTNMPEELRLVDSNGLIRPENFIEGRISLNFWAIAEGLGRELDLNGTITSIKSIPEPRSLLLLVLGLLILTTFRNRRTESL